MLFTYMSFTYDLEVNSLKAIFVCMLLNGFKHCYLTLTELFAHSQMVSNIANN